MIETVHLIKKFDENTAVSDVSLSIQDGQVFGLVGTNGAGKSTFLRMLCGVLRPDSGTILVENRPVYDNPEVKSELFFIPDEPYFFAGSSARDITAYLKQIYKNFDSDLAAKLMKDFGLDENRRIDQFSKGMKKQLAVILGIASGTKYLLCDETFDGLDPVMRQAVKSLFAAMMEDRGLTPVLTSHNLRELEDICDHMGLLHQGGVILSRDIDDMKLHIQKVQFVYRHEPETDDKVHPEFGDLQVLTSQQQGRVRVMTVRGTRKDVERVFAQMETVFHEILSPSLEEIFISETEVAGYDVKKFILS